MKQEETKLTVRVADLTRLCTSNQKAIEELVEKTILLAQNLNTQQFRLMVTERLVKEKLGITPDEIMAAGLEAIEDDRRQKEAELERQSRDGAGTATAPQDAPAATAEPRHTGAAATSELTRTALQDGAVALEPRRLQSIPRSLQTQ